MVLGLWFESVRVMFFLCYYSNALPVPMLRQVYFSIFRFVRCSFSLFFIILSALASRDRHLEPFGGLGVSFLTFWDHFGISGAPLGAILAPREHLGMPFWHPGGSWEQQAGHEVANDTILVDFWCDFRTYLCQFFGPKILKKSLYF